jgi:hypothetical protein
MQKNWLIITADTKEKAYTIAAEEFKKYYKQITGETLAIAQTDDEESNLILIGNWAVNPTVAKYTVDGPFPKRVIRSGTDEFLVKTCKIGDRKVLLLQGGLGRSTLYAVYAYFEALGCKWYWDGDVVPTLSKEEVEEKEFDIIEKPRFLYRGLRYFAHRGAKRFRAEMWNEEDWKQEIDYLSKRRLNLFMLRIGQDDLFQRAFPKDVSYPTEKTMDLLCRKNDYLCGGFEDRRLFWSLEYRGKLREKILSYAFDRGFMHPEDFGTMTHWYSLTPQDFLDKKHPTVFKNHTGYDEKGCIWDIRETKNFEYYMQLTKTHIQAFGKAELFHTIGFAERKMYPDDREKNLAMKTYVYERYTQKLQEDYPNCPILIAAWDYWLTYTPEEVCKSLSQMDKNSCILFDYTSDSLYSNNFTAWNVVGNFPYVFGIFQGYECFNDCVGHYPITQERLQIAKADEYCKGLIYWPEISHSDTLMQEFFMQNTWDKEVISVEKSVERMCEGRYVQYRAEMERAWQEALPCIELLHWSMPKEYFSDWAEYNYFSIGPSFLNPLLDGNAEKALSDTAFLAQILAPSAGEMAGRTVPSQPAARQRRKAAPKKKKDAELARSQFQIRDAIVHPVFGNGIVKKVNRTESTVQLVVAFESGGEKKLSEAWVLENCRRE